MMRVFLATEAGVPPFILTKHTIGLSVRPARSGDLDEVRRVIEASRHVHLQLDWWTLEDWIDNPGFLVAQSNQHIVGMGLGVRDAAAVAWLRALVAEDGLDTGRLLSALLPPMLAALRSQGIQAMNCMAWLKWLEMKLPEHGFFPLARVVTLRKDDMAAPIPLAGKAVLREANSADLDAVVAIDHAAFEPDWWYGQAIFFRAMRGAIRFIVAERDSQTVGYAFAHMNSSQAHVTRLAVHPSYQGQGIGALLMADLIEYSRAHGADAMTLNTQTYNQNSLRLYHRLGFIETDTAVTMFRRSVNE